MSELKGQILGIVLVVILFGLLALAMSGQFSDLIGTFEDRMTEVIGTLDGLVRLAKLKM